MRTDADVEGRPRAIEDVTCQSRYGRRRPVTLKRLTPCLVVHGMCRRDASPCHFFAISLIAVPARVSGKRAVLEGWVMVEIYGT